MISDFSGSTTEPVKRKISVQVVSARIASAHGRCAASDACWSTKRGRLPGDARVGQLRAHRVDELLRAVGETLVAREDVEAPEAGCHLPRRQRRRPRRVPPRARRSPPLAAGASVIAVIGA